MCDNVHEFPGTFGERDIDEIDNVIYLTNEEGEDEAFEMLDIIEYSDKEYVVLLPVGYDEVVILETVMNENGIPEEFLSVEDDGILMAVFQLFRVRNKDNFNFED